MNIFVRAISMLFLYSPVIRVIYNTISGVIIVGRGMEFNGVQLLAMVPPKLPPKKI